MEIKPGKEEFEQARKACLNALEDASKRLQKQSETNIDLIWTEDDHIIQNMNGARGMPYGSKIIQIRFNTEPERWEENLKVTVAHEYAHLWYSEKTGKSNKHRWAYFIEEGLTQNFANSIYPDIPQAHRTSHSVNDMKQYWPRVRELIQGPRLNTWDPIFFGNKEFPKWLGYSMSYQIGKKILENTDFNKWHEIEKEDVINSGDKTFL